MKSFQVEILTPSKSFLNTESTCVTLPGSLGGFQVLYNHAPIISTLEIGKIVVKDLEGKDTIYANTEGSVEVVNNKVLILVNSIEKAEAIDTKRAEAALERAKSRLAKKHDEEIDEIRAEAALNRAMNRLKVSSYIH
ncbi:MAG: F0F1 ATP synthase subunit epsilon [Ignavibacteriaceae bacterium]|nr:F0F1 ATP synthase subunit epsilon [Ignavibacteriaceae bacterium]